MDWQSWTAAAIALSAGLWAAWKILGPIFNEFRKKKTEDHSCGGCGGGCVVKEKGPMKH